MAAESKYTCSPPSAMFTTEPPQASDNASATGRSMPRLPARRPRQAP